MELILWRHADAEDGFPDAQRALTAKGQRQAKKVAAWLRPRLDDSWEILVSPAKRARQTADALHLDYRVCPELDTGADAQAILREAGWPGHAGNVLLVGHQPTLGQAAASLLLGRAGDLAIRKGSLWWFRGRHDADTGEHETTLRAVITPDVAG